MRLIIAGLFSLFLFTCLSFQPELEWEDVTSDHEPILKCHGSAFG